MVRGAAVDLDNLLEAALGEDADSVGSLGGNIDRVGGEANNINARLEGGPLLVCEEEVVRVAHGLAPLVGRLHVCRAERLHQPIRLGGVDEILSAGVAVPEHPVAVLVGATIVRAKGGGAASRGARADGLTLEVEGVLDDVASGLDHRRRRVRVRHVVGELLAVIVNVVDVRAGERGRLAIHRERVRLPVLTSNEIIAAILVPVFDWTIRLRLHEHAGCVVIDEVGAHAVGHTSEHLAGLGRVLADSEEGLQVAEGEVGVARLSIFDLGTSD